MRTPTATQKTPTLRRSARIQLRVLVKVSGAFHNGSAFSEDTHTLAISKFGARIKTGLALKPGLKINVQPKFSKKSGQFRVVWVGAEGTPRAGEAGIEYVTVSDLLGIQFP